MKRSGTHTLPLQLARLCARCHGRSLQWPVRHGASFLAVRFAWEPGWNAMETRLQTCWQQAELEEETRRQGIDDREGKVGGNRIFGVDGCVMHRDEGQDGSLERWSDGLVSTNDGAEKSSLVLLCLDLDMMATSLG